MANRTNDTPLSERETTMTAAEGVSARSLVAGAFASGVIASLLLSWVTSIVARSNMSGDGWSLAGNGALIVPLIGAPVVVMGGATVLMMRFGAIRRWWVIAGSSLALLLGLMAGFVALILLLS
jgi:hypothetical protein